MIIKMPTYLDEINTFLTNLPFTPSPYGNDNTKECEAWLTSGGQEGHPARLTTQYNNWCYDPSFTIEYHQFLVGLWTHDKINLQIEYCDQQIFEGPVGPGLFKFETPIPIAILGKESEPIRFIQPDHATKACIFAVLTADGFVRGQELLSMFVEKHRTDQTVSNESDPWVPHNPDEGSYTLVEELK